MNAPCPLLTPTVELLVDIISKARQHMLATAEGLTPDRLLRIPPGFRNNLLWNFGHVVVAQQRLCYDACGLPLRVPAYFPPLFRKGTSPADWTGQIDFEEVKIWMIETPKLLREDLENNRFGEFKPYDTSFGVRLAHLSDFIAFTACHENQHLGIVMALRKLV